MDESKEVITNNSEEEKVEEKTFTQEEVLKLIQSETDKRVTQALKTQQKKYEKQLSLSQLDGDAREKAEKDRQMQQLQEVQLQEVQQLEVIKFEDLDRFSFK